MLASVSSSNGREERVKTNVVIVEELWERKVMNQLQASLFNGLFFRRETGLTLRFGSGVVSVFITCGHGSKGPRVKCVDVASHIRVPEL